MSTTEPNDASAYNPGFGRGGVPWYLLLFYLAFLGFFAWYSLEYQLDDYLEKQAVKEAPADTGGGR
jgi:hypothetical protein